MSTRAALGLGSNLGDRLGHLQAAVGALAAEVGVLALSGVHETDPVGGPEQQDYLNAVIVVEAAGLGEDDEARARALLGLAHRIEADRDREREVRWGPRTLDVDVLAVGGLRLDSRDLTVPHPRAHQRAFVLVPWDEADPEMVLPGRGALAVLLDQVGRDGVRPRRDLTLQVPR